MVPEVAGGMVAEKHFRRLLSKVDVVSFDVFGTLLERACVRPEFVFDLAFARWSGLPLENDGPFARARSAADDSDVYGRPMTLEEIYERIPCLTASERSEIKSLEVECERRVLFARSDVREMYEAAVSMGKQIVAISDMYLPSEVIADLLAENGYFGIERVFVSCEHGCEKGDGRLIRKVAGELGVNTGQILHVGDSLRSDVLGAVLSGARCFYVGFGILGEALGVHHVPTSRKPAKLSSPHYQLSYGQFASRSINDAEALGYYALGPLLVSFCEWVHGQVPEGAELFFLARDAKLPMRVYEELYSGETMRVRYLNVSRRTLNSVHLLNCTSLQEVRSAIGLPRVVTPASFASAAGVGSSAEARRLFEAAGFEWLEASDLESFLADSRLCSIERRLLQLICANAGEMKALLVDYLKYEGVSGGDYIVDVGWHGSAQRAIESALDVRLVGLYIGTNDTEDLISRGYLYDDTVTDGDSLMAGYWGLFESFFASGDGITTGYERSDDGIIPLKAEPEFDSAALSPIYSVQSGVMRFVHLYANTIGVGAMGGLDHDFAMRLICDVAEHPSLRQLKVFGSIPFLDFGRVMPIVATPRRMGYLRSPKLLKEDFFNSTWRIGFMKRTLLLPLDYSKAFRLARIAFRKGLSK